MDSKIQGIETLGPCGKKYCFKPEYSEAWVLCPNCKQTYQVPKAVDESKLNALERYLRKRDLTPDKANETVRLEKPWQLQYEVDQVDWMGRETYLFKEKDKEEVMAVGDRPGYFKNALIFGVSAWVLVSSFLLSKVLISDETIYWVVSSLGLVLLVLWSVLLLLRFKIYQRDITFFADDRLTKPMFQVIDENKIEFPRANFTLRDLEGNKLARFSKPWKNDLFRTYWEIFDQNDRLIFYVIEESVLLSLLRRLFFSKLFWFRINFIFKNPAEHSTIGEYKRSWMIKDFYRLDMSLNSIELDIRTLMVMGVLLDTVERR